MYIRVTPVPLRAYRLRTNHRLFLAQTVISEIATCSSILCAVCGMPINSECGVYRLPARTRRIRDVRRNMRPIAPNGMRGADTENRVAPSAARGAERNSRNAGTLGGRRLALDVAPAVAVTLTKAPGRAGPQSCTRRTVEARPAAKPAPLVTRQPADVGQHVRFSHPATVEEGESAWSAGHGDAAVARSRAPSTTAFSGTLPQIRTMTGAGPAAATYGTRSAPHGGCRDASVRVATTPGGSGSPRDVGAIPDRRGTPSRAGMHLT